MDTEVHIFLERARVQFPNNDLIKLNLAQILFKKDFLVSALNLLSELKTDDSLLNVQLELMNLMQIKSYSLFHRMQLQDKGHHLKNWFVYLINNEDWGLLYALNPEFQGNEKWSSDDFIYAMAYSSQIMSDVQKATQYGLQVKSPNLAQKKQKLLDSLSSPPF